MTEKEFIDWIRGYVDGVHTYSVSPKQWQFLKDKVKSISGTSIRYTIDSEKWTTNVS